MTLLQVQRVDTTASRSAPLRLEATLQSAFADGAQIDKKHSNYFDDVSPPQRWNAVEGARSYAVIVEDADAKPVAPPAGGAVYFGRGDRCGAVAWSSSPVRSAAVVCTTARATFRVSSCTASSRSSASWLVA